jgi:hypothetical protein
MKYFLFVVVMGLSLAGCGEQGPGKSASTGSVSVPPAAKNRSVIKATSERPSAIPATLGSGAACQVDWVNDAPAQKAPPVTNKAKVRLVGWAADLNKGTSSQGVFIALVGPSKFYFEALSGLKRGDVVSAYKKPGLANAGWDAYADLSGVSAGAYKIQVIQVDGSSGSACDTGRSIVIN